MAKHGDLKIWWVPQVPMKAFEVEVSNLREASLLLDTLADYDRFQFENNVKPDYCNAGGLVEFDGGAADWFDWESDDGLDFDEVRHDPELLAQAMEARSAKTEGLGPSDDSAVPQECAPDDDPTPSTNKGTDQ